jgi:alpha-1,2-mannosyltransferase
MGAIWQRVAEYVRVAWWMANYALLAAFWLTMIDAFYDHMAPRLSYLTAHRAIADDLPCAKPECDFSLFWPAGRLAREHAYTALYTPQIFVKTASAMVLPGSRLVTFFYPPHMLLPAALISHLPFEWGYFVWTFGMVLIACWPCG